VLSFLLFSDVCDIETLRNNIICYNWQHTEREPRTCSHGVFWYLCYILEFNQYSFNHVDNC